MAVDETLLESALDGGTATVRVYQWSAPTVSLGYFQDADEFERDPQWHGFSAVRRLSGGGAILHDREITYSLTLPPAHRLTAQPSRLYRLAHEAIIGVLATHGITVHMRGAAGNGVAFGSPLNEGSLAPDPSPLDPFLCFGRGDANDIVLGAHKIVGSAQRRRRGAVLQHGSVLLERSPHAAEFPGLRELTGVEPDRAKLSAEVGAAFAAALAVPAEPAVLSPDELSRARDLEQTRYSTLRWRPHAVSSNDN
jgi:lipoate-protein ligase A